MKTPALAFGIVVSVLLLSVAAALHFLALNSGAQSYRDTILLLRQIQQLSTQWSMEVATARSDPLGNFDSVSVFGPQIQRLKEQLTSSVPQLPEVPRRLANDVNGFGNALDAQHESIERFKSGFSVVRNSARYLPLAATNVNRLARDADLDSLVRRIEALSGEVSVFVDNPTNAARNRLSAELAKLRDESISFPPGLTNALANFISHATVLLEKQGPTEELFQKATSGRTSVLTDRLVGNMRFERAKRESLALRYERGMLATIAVLALFWVGLSVQQRRYSKSTESASHTPLPLASPGVALGQDPDTLAYSTGPSAGTEANLELRFLAQCVAANLSASASRLIVRLDFLAQAQHRIGQFIGQSDALSSTLNGGVNMHEEVQAAGAVATSVRREMGLLGDLGRRLALSASAPSETLGRAMVDVNSCIEESLRVVDADRAATVATKLRDIPEIWASKAEIQLLLTKVIENAVHAVQEQAHADGAISIDTEQRDDSILVRVIDNGVGISADSQERVFRPFYSSRDGATGIGLSLAHHLAAQYEGGIEINSLPDQGTVVRIVLPAIAPDGGRELFGTENS